MKQMKNCAFSPILFLQPKRLYTSNEAVSCLEYLEALMPSYAAITSCSRSAKHLGLAQEGVIDSSITFIFNYNWIIMVVSLTTPQWLLYTVLFCFLMP